MHGNGLIIGVALLEIVAFQNAGYRELARDAQQILELELEQPLRVVDKRRFLGIEDLERLVDVGLRVVLHLFGGELGTCGVSPRRVAYERRAVTDDERDLMA